MAKTPFFLATTQIRLLFRALDLVETEADKTALDAHAECSELAAHRRAWRLVYGEKAEGERRWFELSLSVSGTKLFTLISPGADLSGKDDAGEPWLVVVEAVEHTFTKEGIHDAVNALRTSAWKDFGDYLLIPVGRSRVLPLKIPDEQRGSSIAPFAIGIIVQVLNWFAQIPSS